MHQFRLSLLHQELLYEDFSFSETFMYSIFMLYTIVHYRLTCVLPRYFWEAYDASLSTTADGSLYGSVSAGREKRPFNVLFFLKVEPPCDQT